MTLDVGVLIIVGYVLVLVYLWYVHTVKHKRYLEEDDI